MLDVTKKGGDFFDRTHDFSSSINRFTLGFCDPFYEEEYLKSKYEKKNLLTAIGINLFFNMLLIGIRTIVSHFKRMDDLNNYMIPEFSSFLTMIFWNIGLGAEVIIFIIPGIKILRGFLMTLFPIVGIIGSRMYTTYLQGSSSIISFPPTIVYYLMVSIISVLLYSANWVCGAIQIILISITLAIGYIYCDADHFLDTCPYIILTCSAALCVILTVYFVEYFQRKATFMRLQAEKERNYLKQILDKLPQPICIATPLGIKYSNEAFKSLSNPGELDLISESEFSEISIELSNQKDLPNNNSVPILTKIINKETNESLDKFVTKGEDIQKMNFELALNKGPKNLFEVNSLNLGYENERFKLYLLNNMTYYNYLKKNKDKAKYLRTYFASITHDFRTPLSIASGNTEILLNLIKDQNQRKHLINISNSCTMLSLLVQDILDYSQMKEGNLELATFDFELEKEFNLVVDLFIDKYKSKKLYLNLNIQNDCPSMIYNDGNRIKQVLMNLLSNAFKFTLKGGVQITVSYSLLEGLIIVAVKDSGVGMTEEEAQTLFKEFSKIKTHKNLNPNGIGLGLHICQRLVFKLGGVISVQSKQDESTTFTFSFKANANDMKEEKHSEKVHSSHESCDQISSSRSKPNLLSKSKYLIKHPRTIQQLDKIKDQISTCNCSQVLIVDDDVGIRQILLFYANSFNMKCEEANNGKEAVEKVKDKLKSICCPAFSLIFTDYYMPEMDGVQSSIAIKEILQSHSIDKTKIILISGLSNEELKRINSLPLMPFVSIEPKPLPKSKFAEIIKKYVNIAS